MSSTKETFENQLEMALAENPYLSGRNVRFETREGRIVLRGVVNSYFQKQMAQESLRRIEGVSEIDNELTVTWA
ncbi:MAG: BON domain-containing protein [Pirellulaceae bacterium]